MTPDASYEHISGFDTFEEAAAAAVILAVEHDAVYLDVFVCSRKAAFVYGGNNAVETFLGMGGEAAIIERLEIKTINLGSIEHEDDKDDEDDG